MIYLYNNISILLCAFFIKHIKCTYKKNIFLFFCLIQMTLIVGLRQGVGADYFSYLKIYNYLNGICQYKYHYTDVEVGYELINILCGYLGIPYWGLNIIMAFLTNLFVVCAIKEFKIDACLAVYMYISFFFFYHSMNQTRQGLAMAIGIYAISQLAKKRNIVFLSLVIFAMSFHTVAIVYLPLLVLKRFPITKKRILIYFVGTILALTGFKIIVMILTYTKYGVYFDPYYDKQKMTSTIMNLLIRGIMLLFALFFEKKVNNSITKNILYHMILLCTCFQAITVQSSVFGRITTPFFIGYIILIPMIINSITQTRRKMMYILCYFGAGIYQLVYYFLMKAAVLVNDYKSIIS